MINLTSENTTILRTVSGSEVEIEYDGKEYRLFNTREDAEDAVEEYWRDMIEYDPKEFICMVGADNLVAWCMGQMAGPGLVKVKSLEDWIQLARDYCYEDLARYDGYEVEVTMDSDLVDTIEFTPASVYYAYRTA